MSGGSISFRSNTPPRVGDFYTPPEPEIEGSDSEEPISIAAGRWDEYPTRPTQLNYYSPSTTPEFPEKVPESVKTPEPLEIEKGAPTIRHYSGLAAAVVLMFTGLLGGPLTLPSNLYAGIGLFCVAAVGLGLAILSGRAIYCR
jgi:hypothetical protein